MIDLHHPGAVGAYLRSGHHRRQVIAAALSPTLAAPEDIQRDRLAHFAQVSGDVADDELCKAVGVALTTLRNSDLLRRAFDQIDGLAGALRRVAHPFGSKFFIDLHMILTRPEYRGLARALRNQPLLTPRLLRAGMRLPLWFCQRPGALQATSHISLDDLVASISIIQAVCPTATTAVLAATIPSCGSRGALHSWVASWIRRADLPASPVDDPFLRPILRASDLVRAGRNMRNCLATMLPEVLARTKTYLQARVEERDYVVELERHGDLWVAADVYGYRNRPVDARVAQMLLDRLRSLSIDSRPADKDDYWEPIRRSLSRARITNLDDYLDNPVWLDE